MKRLLKRLFTPPLIVLAALLMFLEEWLWVHLQQVMAAFGRLPLVRGAEAAIARLPPYRAMAVFLLPIGVLFPVKVAALWLIAQGRGGLGVLIILAAKVVGTALVTRIFSLCKPSLLTLGWFQRLHDWVLMTKECLYAYVRALPPWQAARHLVQTIRLQLRGAKAGLLTGRWRAVRAWLRSRA